MSDWIVTFSENGEEYVGSLKVTAKRLRRDSLDEKVFYADGVRIEIDEHIINIERMKKR